MVIARSPGTALVINVSFPGVRARAQTSPLPARDIVVRRPHLRKWNAGGVLHPVVGAIGRFVLRRIQFFKVIKLASAGTIYGKLPATLNKTILKYSWDNKNGHTQRPEVSYLGMD